MPSCVMRKCKNYGSKATKDHGITYHSFPANAYERERWIAIVRVQRSENDWLPAKGSRVCSVHFKDEDKYTSNTGRILLKNKVVPFVEVPELITGNISPSCLEYIDMLDNVHNNMFDNPAVAALKSEIEDSKLQKDEIYKQNRLLKKKIKRLQAKATSAKKLLKYIKEKKYVNEEQFSELSALFDIKNENVNNSVNNIETISDPELQSESESE